MWFPATREEIDWWRRVLCLLVFAGGLVSANVAVARYDGPLNTNLSGKDGQGIYTVKGDFVMNVGQAQCNITNFGLIGSQPGSRRSWSDAPSMMWPAGSGVDYLWSAGLWFGAIKNGVPAVSTGQYELEFRADSQNPLATIYRMKQGEPGYWCHTTVTSYARYATHF